jgi:DNA-directed RNA polymerase specialized sigma24 family protein
VISDTWITIIQKVETVKDPNALPGWLARVAQRKSYKHLREVHNERDVPFEENQQSPDGAMATVQQELEAAERINKFLTLAETISLQFRKILERFPVECLEEVE